MIGKWTGTPLRTFLERVGADTTARYVGFECADGYYESMDMPTALHPQTIMAFKLSDEVLPRKYGYPFKIRVPTKLGFKNPEVRDNDVRDKSATARILDRSWLQLVQWDLTQCKGRGTVAAGVVSTGTVPSG